MQKMDQPTDERFFWNNHQAGYYTVFLLGTEKGPVSKKDLAQSKRRLVLWCMVIFSMMVIKNTWSDKDKQKEGWSCRRLALRSQTRRIICKNIFFNQLVSLFGPNPKCWHDDHLDNLWVANSCRQTVDPLEGASESVKHSEPSSTHCST